MNLGWRLFLPAAGLVCCQITSDRESVLVNWWAGRDFTWTTDVRV